MSAESLNTCTLSGNLGNDAEVKYTAGGMAITVFSLAVNHRRKLSKMVAMQMRLAGSIARYLASAANRCKLMATCKKAQSLPS